MGVPFLSRTQPAKPSSMSQRYTLDMPPSKYLLPSALCHTRWPHVADEALPAATSTLTAPCTRQKPRSL